MTTKFVCMETGVYSLLDSGGGQKLERFGAYAIARPCGQAIWRPQRREWTEVDAQFSREEGAGWSPDSCLPTSWNVVIAGLQMVLRPTDFGHLGLFPEQAVLWEWMRQRRPKSVLNLFAYSGAATLAAAAAGASVTHVDASKGMVFWARENAALNGLGAAPIRWIVDDVQKYLGRELRRGHTYDAIVLDPPTFGRGSRQEVFKIERDLGPLLVMCRQLLSEDADYLILSCHTPGYGPLVLRHLLSQMVPVGGCVDSGELLLEGQGLAVPSGAYARWDRHA